MSVYIDLYIKQDKNQPSSQLSQFDPPTSMLLYGSVIGYRPICLLYTSGYYYTDEGWNHYWVQLFIG